MIYLVRHGETEWNRIRRTQGRGDSPLTVLGRRQAEACGRALVDEIDVAEARILTSPLGRARTTAEKLRRVIGLPTDRLVVDHRLAECDCGQWEGLDDEEIEEQFPGERARRTADKWDYQIPGGESYAMVAVRLNPWLKEYRDTGSIVAVTHDMVSRVIRGIYLNLKPEYTLRLVHPQTRIYKLSDGRESVIEADLDVF